MSVHVYTMPNTIVQRVKHHNGTRRLLNTTWCSSTNVV